MKPPPSTAEGWLARLRSGEMSDADMEMFADWLRNPANAAKYDEVRHLWQRMESLRDDPAIVTMRQHVMARPRRSFIPAIAASVAVFLTVGAVWAVFSASSPVEQPEQAPLLLASSVGERRTFTLGDGSRMVLDADSAVRISLSRTARRVEMERGRAMFRVAHNPAAPFTVHSGGKAVVAVGTEFVVEILPDTLKVALLEGRVRVIAGNAIAGNAIAGNRAQLPDPIEMTPGMLVEIGPDGHWRRDQIGVAATAWMQGRLVFDNRPLSEAVAEMNRYAPHPISIADADIGKQHITAVLNAADTATFVKSVEMIGAARAHVGPNGAVTLKKNLAGR